MLCGPFALPAMAMPRLVFPHFTGTLQLLLPHQTLELGSGRWIVQAGRALTKALPFQGRAQQKARLGASEK